MLDIEEEQAYWDLEGLDKLSQQPIYEMCNTNQFINYHRIAPTKHRFPESQRLVLAFLLGSDAIKLTQTLGHTDHV